MKHKIIPSLHSLIIIIACFALAGSFIFLSMQKLNEDVEMISETIDLENMYKMKNVWEEPKYTTKQIDVSFKYDTRQVDNMHVVHYEITNETGPENITQKEIDVMLDCYRNEICDEVDISAKTEHLINDYKNFIIKNGVVVVYGLYPKTSEESFGEIDSNVFVIKEDLFAKIVNPIYSKTNQKYDKIRRNFLMNNINIDYNSYLNDARITQKNEMVQNVLDEIRDGEVAYIKDDLELLKIITESVEIIEKEEN